MTKENIEVTFRKRGAVRYLAHLDLVRIFEQAARRSGLPVRFTEGFNPRVKLSFSRALTLGVESECETLVLGLTEDVDPGGLVEALNAQLPEGIEATEAGPRREWIGGVVETYEAFLEDPAFEVPEEACRDILAREEIPVQRTRKGVVKTFDARPMIRSLSAAGPGRLCVELVPRDGRCLRLAELFELLAAEVEALPPAARIRLLARTPLDP